MEETIQTGAQLADAMKYLAQGLIILSMFGTALAQGFVFKDLFSVK